MQEKYRMVFALILFFGFYFFWEKYVLVHYRQVDEVSQKQSFQQKGAAETLKVENSFESQFEGQKEELSQNVTKEIKTLKTSQGTVFLSDQGSFLNDAVLENFFERNADRNQIALKVINESGQSQGHFSFDLSEYAYLSSVKGKWNQADGSLESQSGVLDWDYSDKKVKIHRHFKSSLDRASFELQFSYEFMENAPNYLFLSIQGQSASDDAEARDRQIVLYTEKNGIERISIQEKNALKNVNSVTDFLSVSSRYFVLGMFDESVVKPTSLLQSNKPYQLRANLVYPVSQKRVNGKVRFYFGPKEVDLLDAEHPKGHQILDLGFFSFVSVPILKVLKLFYSICENYGLSIILLTLALKLVTFPLTYKSMKSMKKMSELQPQLNELKEKYKDDKEALNRHLMVFMKEKGYNPVAGCLPMLLQWPIFISLYQVLYSSIELYHAPFALWIKDLSSQDPYFVTPVLLSIAMYLQQKMTPLSPSVDPAQAKMMQFMPLIFGMMMIPLPAGLTLYMLVNALAGMLQQGWLNRKQGDQTVASGSLV